MLRICLVLWLALLTACAADERPAKTYETRGVIRRLPVEGTPDREVFIFHESIPTFESLDGDVTGMDAMAMGFPIADPAMLEGLEVGDKVSFTLQVDWDGSPPLAVTALAELPAETRLEFESATEEPGSSEDPPNASEAEGSEAGTPEAPDDTDHGHHASPDADHSSH